MTQLNLSTITEKMNFQDKNITNLIANLEVNTLNQLMRNGLIISYMSQRYLPTQPLR